ncbi:MAG: hypothetical protein HGA44_18030, partial [Cellulomonadaceae bacterium]|nr:hypothetical protein [Cellulomonadaceae bacterium]
MANIVVIEDFDALKAAGLTMDTAVASTFSFRPAGRVEMADGTTVPAAL